MSTSQRCKVTFESSAAILTRYYVLVAPEGQRYAEVCSKVQAEFAKPDFDEGKELESLYWIDSATDVVIVDSEEAYDSAVSMLVPDQDGLLCLKLFVQSKPIGSADGARVTAVRGSRNSTTKVSNGGKSNWQFRCKKCPLSFHTIRQLRGHQNAHLETRRLRHQAWTLKGQQGPVLPGLKDEEDTAAPVEIISPLAIFDKTHDKSLLAVMKSTKLDSSNVSEEGASEALVRTPQKSTFVPGEHGGTLGFPCPKCERVFETVRQVRGHQAAHTTTHWKRRPKVLAEAEILSIDKTEDGHDTSIVDEVTNGDSSTTLPSDGEGVLYMVTNPQKTFPAEGDDGEFPCQKCDRVFQKVRQLRGHQAAHSVIHWKRRKTLEKLAAALSDNKSSLVNEPELEAHQSQRLESQQKTEGQMLPSPYDLPDDLQFPCTKCDKVFVTIRQMRGHQAAHTSSHKKRRKSKAGKSLNPAVDVDFSGTPNVKRIKKMNAMNGSSTPASRRSKQSVIAQLAMGSPSDVDADVDLVAQSAEDQDGEIFSGKLPCPKCERTFDTKRQLRGHQALHSEKGKFMCQVCHCGFRTMDIMQAHQDRCSAVLDASIEEGPSTEEKWSCVSACGKRFTLKRRLTEHRVLCGFVHETVEDEKVDIAEAEPIAVANGVVRVDDVVNWIAREDDAKGIIRGKSVEGACTPVALEDSSPAAELEPVLPSSPPPVDEEGEKSEVVAGSKKRKLEDLEVEMPKFFIPL